MKKIEVKAIKKLTKQRRKLYVCSTFNQQNLVNHLGAFIPILIETIAEIKKNQQNYQQNHAKQLLIRETSQLFVCLTDKEKKEAAINSLDYLLFCFENGCKTIKSVIRQEMMPLIKKIEHLIDFELKRVIKPSKFTFWR